MEKQKEPIAAALQIPEDVMARAGFNELEDYTDVLTCKEFEGLKMEPWLFTDEAWEEMHLLQAIKLGSLEWNELSWLCSKLMDRPFQAIDYKVKRLIGEITEPVEVYEQMKLMIYDGHDSQAVPYLHWLRPTNIEYPQPTLYATEISTEVYFSPECLE